VKSGGLARALLRGTRRLGAPGARVGAIGLELAWEGLRAVQLERKAAGLGVRATARAPWPGQPEVLLGSDEAVRNFVRTSLRAATFCGRRIVTAMPPGGVKLMALGYRSDAGDTDDSARILELVGERVRENLSDLVVDYQPVRTNAEKHGEKSALVAVARREEVIAHLERLRAAGLRVEALEIAPAAIRRLVDRIETGAREQTLVVIHGDGPSSALLVLWGRRLILYRELEFSETAAMGRVAKQLDLEADAARSLLETHGVGAATGAPTGQAPDVAGAIREIVKPDLYALAEEVRRAAIHTAAQTHGAAIDGIRLLGGCGHWPGVADFLSEEVSIEALPLDPLAGFRAGGTPASVAFATVTGLALRDFGTS